VNADDVDHVVLARSMSMPSFSVPAPALSLSLSLSLSLILIYRKRASLSSLWRLCGLAIECEVCGLGLWDSSVVCETPTSSSRDGGQLGNEFARRAAPAGAAPRGAGQGRAPPVFKLYRESVRHRHFILRN
jgi:hypothetical protein